MPKQKPPNLHERALSVLEKIDKVLGITTRDYVYGTVPQPPQPKKKRKKKPANQNKRKKKKK